MVVDHGALHFIINHVVFPPQTPQQEDVDILNGEKNILHLALGVAEFFEVHVDGGAKAAWGSVLLMLKNCEKVFGGTDILEDVLSNLRVGGNTDF